MADLASSGTAWVKQASWAQVDRQQDPRAGAATASSSYAEPLLFVEESDDPQLTAGSPEQVWSRLPVELEFPPSFAPSLPPSFTPSLLCSDLPIRS